jgi:hypothetical protein
MPQPPWFFWFVCAVTLLAGVGLNNNKNAFKSEGEHPRNVPTCEDRSSDLPRKRLRTQPGAVWPRHLGCSYFKKLHRAVAVRVQFHFLPRSGDFQRVATRVAKAESSTSFRQVWKIRIIKKFLRKRSRAFADVFISVWQVDEGLKKAG